MTLKINFKKTIKILIVGAIGLIVLFVAFVFIFGEEHVCTKLTSKEIKQLENRAEAGDIQACKDLSEHFCEDDELSSSWDKKAADLGDPESKYRYGSHLISINKYPEGIRYLTQAAEQCYSFAEYVLGKKYSTGENVEKNIGYAEHWLNKAANHGEVSAMTELSKLYIESFKGKEHLVDSYKWAELAHLVMVNNKYYDNETANIKSQIKEKAIKYGVSFEVVVNKGQSAAMKVLETIPKKNDKSKSPTTGCT